MMIDDVSDISAWYQNKYDLLSSAVRHLDEAIKAMETLSMHDQTSPAGEDPDTQSAIADLTSVRHFIDGTADAVHSMMND